MNSSNVLTTVIAATALGLLGCDNEREAPSQPEPSPSQMREMYHEGAIKDSPSERTGIPATTQSTGPAPSSIAAEAVRNAAAESSEEQPDTADAPADDAADEAADRGTDTDNK